MKKHTNEEIEKFLDEVFGGTIEISVNTEDRVRFSIKQMYEYVNFSFANMTKLAHFFESMNIDEDRYAYGGCSTCDYGSSYTIDVTITDDSNNEPSQTLSEMKDVFGTEIEIGQTVATNHSGYTYRLVLYEVVGFTAQKVKISRKNTLDKVDEIKTKFPEQLAVKK